MWDSQLDGQFTGKKTQTLNPLMQQLKQSSLYQCRAQRGEYYSEFSNTAEITVEVRPKAVVHVHPDENVFRGEKVTLTCHIQQKGDWQYSWNKEENQVSSARQDQKYIIPSVASSHSGLYSCKGTQSKAPTYSQMSDGVTLTVS
ncbi:hypothetical protein M9458_055503, partial [Cirrhinus mrigala]